MARFRRRKPAVSWLPVIGSTTGSQGNEQFITPWSGELILPANLTLATTVFPLTYDTSPEQSLAALQVTNLSDFEGGAYRLRRIVGKFFIAARQTTEAAVNRPPSYHVGLGFMVLRINEETGQPLQTDAQYGLFNADNERDPWIFRRSWMISDNFAQPAGEDPMSNFPQTNAEYGSAFDGPHLDIKTARVIGPEERLFAVISGYGEGALNSYDNTGIAHWVLDVRILGSMRKATNRRNASR